MVRQASGAFSLPRTQRLRTREFQPVFQQRGRRVERPNFVAVWRPRAGPGRVGFAVGRRLANAAERNRGRRRLREAYRRGSARALGFDVVFVGRPALLSASFAALSDDVKCAMQAVARAAEVGGGRPLDQGGGR